MRKKIAFTSMVLAVTLIAGVAGAQVQQRFEDVPTDHYAYGAINWAVDIGVTAGCGDGTNFCPENNLNRAHMVTFLNRYHDWVSTFPVPPPRYESFQVAATAADTWYEEMFNTIANVRRAEGWKEIVQTIADEAARWEGHNRDADMVVHDVRIKSRLGDPLVLDRMGSDIEEQRFYAAAVAWALTRSTSAVAQESTSEREAASAFSWSAAAARLVEHLQGTRDRIWCSGCTIAGRGEFYHWGAFDWRAGARDTLEYARHAYYEFS